MSSKSDTPDKDTNQAHNHHIGPGHVLRTAREQAKLTRADVALHLHLRNNLIEAIESDDYSKMPDFVFVRGYLRAYANLLELPADEIIQTFNDLGLPEPNSGRPKAQFKQTGRHRRFHMLRMMTYGIILGLIVIAALWWNSQRTLKQGGYTDLLSSQSSTTVPVNEEIIIEPSATNMAEPIISLENLRNVTDEDS